MKRDHSSDFSEEGTSGSDYAPDESDSSEDENYVNSPTSVHV